VLPAALPTWHPHPDAWVLIGLLAAAYGLALRRERRRRAVEAVAGGKGAGPGTGPVAGVASRWQVAAFSSGIGLMLLASDWPVHDLAEGYLYSVHMLQHLMLTLGAALLLVLGTPGWLARRLLGRGRVLRMVRGLSRPVLNLVQFNLVLVVSHWPLVVEGTLRYHPLHFVAHAALLVSAVIMWLPVASPLREIPRLAPPAQMLYLFLQTILPTVPASFLTFGTAPLYPLYDTFPRIWGISVITDQQIAGLIMKIGGGLFLWLVIAVVFFRWYEREERRSRDPLLWEDVEEELARLEQAPRPS
jgi:putative membrane protein